MTKNPSRRGKSSVPAPAPAPVPVPVPVPEFPLSASVVESVAATETAENEVQVSYRSSSGRWDAQFEAVAGTRHLNATPPLPCQDAATSATHPRPVVIVADGAGSSSMSDVGAQTVVAALGRLLGTLEQDVVELLDQETAPAPERSRRFALMLVKHAMGVLNDLAQTQRRMVKDFRCTLLLGIVGQAHLLWLKVGDGALVQEKIKMLPDGALASEFLTLGAMGKGDFANETVFVDDRLRPEDVQSGLLPAHDVCGLAAMSDGAALALVSHDGTRVASRLGTWLGELRAGKLKKSTLTANFYEAEFSRKAMGDDCSLALIASALK